MVRIEKTVFISYRRKDISWALLVYKYLTARRYDVFFDYTSIPSGDFEQIIVSNIKARAHFVLILTPAALDRCNEPGDWLRREIETAIDQKRNIIPLFFDDFSFSTPGVAEKLTGKLAALRRYNGMDVPPDYFDAAMQKLSSQYLNIPLEAVLHPVSKDVEKVVKEEQSAANEALEQSKENIKELVKPAAETADGKVPPPVPLPTGGSGGKIPYYRQYGMVAGITVLFLLGVLGINSMLNGSQWPRPPSVTKTIPVTIPVSTTATPQDLIPTRTPEIVATNTNIVTPVPTLGIGSTQVSPKDNMTLLYVPASEFTMGSDNGYENEKPEHQVTLNAYWIDQTEVTNAMYAMCVDDKICNKPRHKYLNTRTEYYENPEFNTYPVVYVTWEDARAYCSWAGRRLPTEAEWEKAARGMDGWNYPWGDAPVSGLKSNNLANNNTKPEAGGNTSEVGSYPDGKSPYGALDMAGNVAEWVNDWYSEFYYKTPSSAANPTGPEQARLKVYRGGSWLDSDYHLRSAYRYGYDPKVAYQNLGFRCARDE